VAAWLRDHEVAAVTALLQLEERRGPSDCSTAYLASMGDGLMPTSAWTSRVLEYQERALRRLPELVEFWARHAYMLGRAGRGSEAWAVLDEGARRSVSALGAIALYAEQHRQHLRRGDTAQANALRGAVSAAVARDGRPGVRWTYLRTIGRQGAIDEQDAVHWETVQLARAAGAWPVEFEAQMSYGQLLLDARGDPLGALRAWDRAAAIADSVRLPALRLEAYVRRGRARAKFGRLADAERDLRHAIAIGTPLGQTWWLAEAYHNLAHAYEGASRLTRASHAADSFIALTRSLRHADIRMMSLRDAGLIRWKAGWHASADAAFAEMVRVVDEHERNHYWAGEYFERAGDLERALRYFRTGIAGGTPSVPSTSRAWCVSTRRWGAPTALRRPRGRTTGSSWASSTFLCCPVC